MTGKSPITTHILDLVSGRPAASVPVVLERRTDGSNWHPVADGVTDADGRVNQLLSATDSLSVGDYRLTFDTRAYFATRDSDAFFPEITISFVVKDAGQHYHVPLLLSRFGYTTYRGS